MIKKDKRRAVIGITCPLYPEGGSGGGLVIAEGSPETLAAEYEKTGSYTGEYLKKKLALHK